MIQHDENIVKLIDDIGSFIEYWGFRKIHGRIWAVIYLSNNSLSTPEIVEKLAVSKALVSGAINELLDHKLIERVGQVKFGGVTYKTTSSPAEVVREIIKNRELVLLTSITDNLKHLCHMNSSDCEKLNINKNSLKNLKTLSDAHKKIAFVVSRKNIKSMEDWIIFIKKMARFSF